MGFWFNLPPGMVSENLFDFYTEVQKNYKALFPKKEEGMVLFLLYQKIKDGTIEKTFSHETLIDTIEEVTFDLNGKVNRNNSPARNNDTIQILLQFYLLRISKGYSLRIFAEDFCKLLENELDARFNPSQIETQFIMFNNALLDAIGSEKTFLIWYSDFFDKNKNQIRKQIEILHNDVDRTINELNILYSSEATDFLTKLKEMDIKVQSLSIDAKKLSAVFVYTDRIVDVLNEHYETPDSFAHHSEPFRKRRKAIRVFFSELTSALQEVSFTIDKIKPQLQRLYGSFEQRDLDRKLEKFVDYVFKNSSVEKNEMNKEEIRLPNSVEYKFLVMDKSKLLYPIQMDFMSLPYDEGKNSFFDPTEHQRQFEKAQDLLNQNQKALLYYNQFLNELNVKHQICYDEYLFDLLEKEGSIEIALKTTHLILRKINSDDRYKITMSNSFKSPSSNPNLAIWETILQYMPS